MRTRILWNDLKGSPLLTVTTRLLWQVSAFMFALTCFLAIGLLGSADTLKCGKQPSTGGLWEWAGER